MPDRARARVLMAGGAALAVAVASCARVLIRGLMPVVLVSLRSRAMRCLQSIRKEEMALSREWSRN
jgi:hypothetical protein